MADFMDRVQSRLRRISDPMTAIVLGSWIVGAILAVLIPIGTWRKERKQYYKYYGYAIEYEQEQQAYEEQQNGNNNNNNGVYFNCKWYQWRCKRNEREYWQYQRNNGDNNNNEDFVTPNWYQTLGGKTEEDQRMREEMGLRGAYTPGALTFVYWWSLILFLAVVVYGAVVFYNGRNPAALAVSLFVFGNAALLMLLLLPQGVISTENRDLEDSIYGWYGQLSVLMVYADFAYFLFCTVFCLFLLARALWNTSPLAGRFFGMGQAAATTSNSTEPSKTAVVDGQYQNMS